MGVYFNIFTDFLGTNVAYVQDFFNMRVILLVCASMLSVGDTSMPVNLFIFEMPKKMYEIFTIIFNHVSLFV